MRIWAILREGPLSEDRAYLMGYLKSRFDSVIVSRVPRDGAKLPKAPEDLDLILNLSGSLVRDFYTRLDELADRLGVPMSPRGWAAWLATDKRLYQRVFADVAPPTMVADGLDAIECARLDLGGDVVVKEPLGGKGTGIVRLTSPNELVKAERLLNGRGGTCDVVIQRYMPGFRRNEKRVIVQRHPENDFEIIGHFRRVPPKGNFIGNLSRGGNLEACKLSTTERKFALEIARRTGLDNVALDIGEDNGKIFYIEHNISFGGIIDYDLMRGSDGLNKVSVFFESLVQERSRVKINSL